MATQSLLLVVIVIASLGAVFLVALAVAAFTRRRSWSYLLVTLALATLLTRALLGGLMLRGLVPSDGHHVVEHGLDVLMIAFLIGAVYCARTVDPRGGNSYD